MPSLAMLVHSFEFVFIRKPRAISIICSPHITLNPVAVKPGFHIVVSVVSVVSVVRKKFIGQIEFILSRTKRCICHFYCIEQLYGRFP